MAFEAAKIIEIKFRFRRQGDGSYDLESSASFTSSKGTGGDAGATYPLEERALPVGAFPAAGVTYLENTAVPYIKGQVGES
jgi:hypothetical protein